MEDDFIICGEHTSKTLNRVGIDDESKRIRRSDKKIDAYCASSNEIKRGCFAKRVQ